jgi:hypothetical protein
MRILVSSYKGKGLIIKTDLSCTCCCLGAHMGHVSIANGSMKLTLNTYNYWALGLALGRK